MREDRIDCLTPTPGKQGTRILKWKYDLIRDAILQVIPGDETGVPFNQLADLLKPVVGEEALEQLGSLGWYATTVKLDMEVRGLIERVPGASPQRLRRAS